MPGSFGGVGSLRDVKDVDGESRDAGLGRGSF